jgi:hypothetical protein
MGCPEGEDTAEIFCGKSWRFVLAARGAIVLYAGEIVHEKLFESHHNKYLLKSLYKSYKVSDLALEWSAKGGLPVKQFAEQKPWNGFFFAVF